MNRNGFGLDVRGKIIFVLLISGGLSAAAIGWIGFQSGRENLTERISAELEARRDLTADGVENYFDQLNSQVAAIAEDQTVRDALRRLPEIFERISKPSSEQETAIQEFYEDTFLPSLPGSTAEVQLVESYLPVNDAARALQSFYIAPTGEDADPAINPGLHDYSRVHDQIHRGLSALSDALNFRDMMLVGTNGRVLYTVDKEVDFATNLRDGAFDSSGLARAYNAAREQRGTRQVHIEDYDFYRPSGGEPAAFMSTPVYNGGTFLGVLVVQISTDRIQQMVDAASQFGASGEVYIAASDGTLRTDLRSFKTDPAAFIESARRAGLDTETLDKIERFGSEVGLLDVANEAVTAAQRGENLTIVFPSIYGGVDLLAAARPLTIDGLSWVIVSEIPLIEAYAPIATFQRQIVIAITVLAIALTLFAMLVSRFMTRPITTLIQRAQLVSQGDLDTPMRLSNDDEFGELSDHLQILTDNLRHERDDAEVARQRIEGLLARFMPARIVRLLGAYDPDADTSGVTDHIDDISIVMIEIAGYDNLIKTNDLSEGVSALDSLIRRIDTACLAAGVEKVRTSGPSYVAAAGLSAPQIDHAQRAVTFASGLVGLVARFRAETNFDLHVKVGVASGPVVAAIVGGKMKAFELFGATKEDARRMSQVGDIDEVRINAALAEQLGDTVKTVAAEDGHGFILEPQSSAGSAQ